jgi:hypothetical protein
LNYADRNAILRDMGYADYAAYRASPLWKAIRRRVRIRDGNRCRICDAGTLIVHHDDYGRETLDGLSISRLYCVCHDCHQSIEFEGEQKRSFVEAQRVFRTLLIGRSTAPVSIASHGVTGGGKWAKPKKKRRKKDGGIVGTGSIGLPGGSPARSIRGKPFREPRPIDPSRDALVEQLKLERHRWIESNPGKKLPARLRMSSIRRNPQPPPPPSPEYLASMAAAREKAAAAEATRRNAAQQRIDHAEELLPTFELRVMARVAIRNAGVRTLAELFKLYADPPTSSETPTDS